MSSNWTANGYVSQMHNIPRFSSTNTFNITAEDYSNEYVKGLTYMPYGILSCLFFLWLGWALSMVSRFFLKCFNCAPAYDTELIRQKSVLKSHVFSIRYLTRIFVFSALLVLVADQVGFVARPFLDASYSTGDDALDFFNNAFTILNDDGIALQEEGDMVLTDAQEAAAGSCPDASVLIPYSEDFSDQVAQYENIISPISGDITNTKGTYDAITYVLRIWVFWGFYGAIFGIVIPFLLGLYFQSKRGLQFNMWWVSFMLLLIWYLCTVQMAFLMGLADFCISPTDNAILLVPTGTTQDVIAYYLTCSGTNPYQQYIDSAYNATDALNATVDELLSTSCPGNTDLLEIQGNVTVIYSYLDNVTATSSCPPFQQQANDILHNAMCYQLFMGTYIQWVSQYVMSGGIFFLLLTSSVIYHYFGRYWNLSEEDIELMQRIASDTDRAQNGRSDGSSDDLVVQTSGATHVIGSESYQSRNMGQSINYGEPGQSDAAYQAPMVTYGANNSSRSSPQPAPQTAESSVVNPIGDAPVAGSAGAEESSIGAAGGISMSVV